MSDTPICAVVICTRNRGKLLEQAVQSALEQTEGTENQVLVVDNGSSDSTPQLLEACAKQYRSLHWMREDRPGLSCARNRALQASAGDVLVFVDDDATLCPSYLSTLRAFWRARRPAVAGGPIDVRYVDEAPPWWSPAFDSYCGAFTLGEAVQTLHFSRYPQGANIAVDRKAALAAGGFNERLGVGPRGPWSGEEMELCARLDASGHAILYHPCLRVTHHVYRRHRTRRWLLRAALYRGRSHFYTTRSYYGEVRWRAFFRQFLTESLRALPCVPLERLVRWVVSLGLLTEANRALLLNRQIHRT